MTKNRTMNRQQRRSKQNEEFTPERYDPNGDKELFVAVSLDITTETFLKARAKNEEKGRQVDFLFKIDGVETEITYEELCDFR